MNPSVPVLRTWKQAKTDADRKACLTAALKTSGQTALLDSIACSDGLVILSTWLKCAQKEPKASSNEDLQHLILNILDIIPIKRSPALELSKLPKRVKKLVDDLTKTPKLRLLAKQVVQKMKDAPLEKIHLRQSTVDDHPSPQPQQHLAVTPRSSQSSSGKRLRHLRKSVTWADNPPVESPRKVQLDTYGGWGLIATKIIPNLEELQNHQREVEAAMVGMTADMSKLNAGPGDSVFGKDEVVQEKVRWTKHKRGLQLDALRKASESRPWRTPRLVSIPQDVLDAKSFSSAQLTTSQKSSFVASSSLATKETIEIPLVPVGKIPVEISTPDVLKTSLKSNVVSYPTEIAREKENDIEYDPLDAYDPAATMPDMPSNMKLSTSSSSQVPAEKSRSQSRWMPRPEHQSAPKSSSQVEQEQLLHTNAYGSQWTRPVQPPPLSSGNLPSNGRAEASWPTYEQYQQRAPSEALSSYEAANSLPSGPQHPFQPDRYGHPNSTYYHNPAPMQPDPPPAVYHHPPFAASHSFEAHHQQAYVASAGYPSIPHEFPPEQYPSAQQHYPPAPPAHPQYNGHGSHYPHQDHYGYQQHQEHDSRIYGTAVNQYMPPAPQQIQPLLPQEAYYNNMHGGYPPPHHPRY